jgi:segregation and condensation protein B
MGTRKTREELDASFAPAEPVAAEDERSESGVAEDVGTAEVAPVGGDSAAVAPDEAPSAAAAEAMAQQLIEPAETASETASEIASESASENSSQPTAGATAPEPAAAEPPASAPKSEREEAEPDAGRAADAGLVPRMKMICESLLFASGQALPAPQMLSVLRELQPDLSAAGLRDVLEQLRTDLREAGRGIRLVEVAGGFQLRTPSESAPFVRRLIARRPPRMTQATIETLAIVAYRQPVTRAEIEDIRGVESGAVVKHLLDRRLIRILGRKEEPGRPLMYGTTKEFLALFSLKDLKSLPTLRDFVELSNEHRAALGLPLKEEEGAAAESEALPGADVLQVEETAAFTPVGDDEIVQELAEALEELKKRNRNLRSLLPVPAEEAEPTPEMPAEAGSATDAAAPDTPAAPAENPAGPPAETGDAPGGEGMGEAS